MAHERTQRLLLVRNTFFNKSAQSQMLFSTFYVKGEAFDCRSQQLKLFCHKYQSNVSTFYELQYSKSNFFSLLTMRMSVKVWDTRTMIIAPMMFTPKCKHLPVGSTAQAAYSVLTVQTHEPVVLKQHQLSVLVLLQIQQSTGSRS